MGNMLKHVNYGKLWENYGKHVGKLGTCWESGNMLGKWEHVAFEIGC